MKKSFFLLFLLVPCLSLVAQSRIDVLSSGYASRPDYEGVPIYTYSVDNDGSFSPDSFVFRSLGADSFSWERADRVGVLSLLPQETDSILSSISITQEGAYRVISFTGTVPLDTGYLYLYADSFSVTIDSVKTIPGCISVEVFSSVRFDTFFFYNLVENRSDTFFQDGLTFDWSTSNSTDKTTFLNKESANPTLNSPPKGTYDILLSVTDFFQVVAKGSFSHESLGTEISVEQNQSSAPSQVIISNLTTLPADSFILRLYQSNEFLTQNGIDLDSIYSNSVPLYYSVIRTSTPQEFIHTYETSGNFQISLEAFFYCNGVVESSIVKETIQVEPSSLTKEDIPNIFTPNNDGINDKFVFSGKSIKDIEVRIFNRRGVRMFKNNTIIVTYEDYLKVGWDGITLGADAPEGIYYYEVTATGYDKRSYSIKGKVYLKR